MSGRTRRRRIVAGGLAVAGVLLLLGAVRAPSGWDLVLSALGGVLVGLGAAAWAEAVVRDQAESAAAALGSGARPPRVLAPELRTLVDTATRAVDAARAEAAEAGRRAAQTSAALEALPFGLAIVDHAGTVEIANPTLRELGVNGAALGDLTPTAVADLVRRTLEAEAAVSGDVEVGWPPRTLAVRAVPLPDGGAVLVVTDVTEARRLAAMRRDFVADASHELKTPIAALHAVGETLQRAMDHDPEAARALARRVTEEASRLGRIVSDLLDLSRLESRGTVAVGAPVDLAEIVRGEAEAARPRAEAAGIDLQVDLAPTPARVDPGDVALAVRNLLDNALRYTPPGGVVHVRTGVDEGDAVIEVRDTGIGIPARDLERIFERFYRVDEARARSSGGTGLGLSIVRHATERHGGVVEVASELGAGSTFRLRFPSSS